MKIVNALRLSNVLGAGTKLKELIGFPKTLHQEWVKLDTFKIEFVTSRVEQYIVVRTKQLLLTVDI